MMKIVKKANEIYKVRVEQGSFKRSPLYFGLLNLLSLLLVMVLPIMLLNKVNNQVKPKYILGATTTMDNGVRVGIKQRLSELTAISKLIDSQQIRSEIERLQKLIK